MKSSRLAALDLRTYLVVLVLLVVSGRSWAQGTMSPSGSLTSKADTTKGKIKQMRPGFDLPDSLYVPTDSIHADVDTIIRYTAKDSTVFDVAHKRMVLTNDATVQFQNRELKAYTIVMDFESNTLTAYSSDYDSVLASTLGLRRRIIRDTSRVKSRGAPILHEGAIPYEGEVIVYNFKTRRGTVQLGTTAMEGGFYYGEKIKQVAPQTLFVENGRFTTCDAPVPHYYFESPRMKVIAQDRVFAEPVYLYIADVPIFALPFGLFPNHSGGRRSGLIAPNYQVTGDRGYGLTHLGWYQIFSDYFDAYAQGDIYTRGGYNLEAQASYMKRYLLSGPATAHFGYGFTRTSGSDDFTKNWNISTAIPNVILGDETRFSANLNYASAKYYRNTARSQRDLLQQQISSNAAFQTGWSDIGVSLDVDYNRLQWLDKNTYTEESPSINISKSTFFPFASTDGTDVNPTLASLGISYRLAAKRHLERNLNRSDLAVTDTTTWYNREQYGVLHTPSISISPRLGYFTVSPSFSYQEAWLFKSHYRNYYLDYRRDTVNNRVDTVLTYRDSTVSGFHRLYNYNFGVNVATNLYGIANINAFGLTAIRHTLSPQISLNYHPDLSDQELRSFVDPRRPSNVQYYDLYTGELNAGIASGQKSATLSFSLGNDFEAKVQRQVTADSTAEERVKLLNLGASSGYDVINKRLSPLSISAFTTIANLFNIHTNLEYSFYPKNYLGGDSLPSTLIALGHGFLRAVNATFDLNGSFSSSTTTDGDNYDSLRRLVNITSPEDEREMFLGGTFPGGFVSVPFRPRWSINYSLTYRQTFDVQNVSPDFGASMTLDLGLTKNWSINTTAFYSLREGRLSLPEIRIHRDLHCWEMNFSYRPPGSGFSGFNFEIRVKAPQLQDVKLTRTENSYGEF